MKNSVVPLLLRRNCRSVANRIKSYFCHSAVGGQPISILVTSSLCRRFQHFRFSPATATVVTERKNGNGTTERHNGTAEQNGETATAERQQNGGNQA